MKSAAHEILDRIGVDALLAARGVGRDSIRLIKFRKVFPESWFLVVTKLARERDVDLDEICARWGVSLEQLFQASSRPPGKTGASEIHDA